MKIKRGSLYYRVKRMVRSSLWAYSIVTGFRGLYSENDWRPTQEKDVFVTSWGRSGNTFAFLLISIGYQNHEIASHGHNIASIKMARNNKVPILLTLREPSSAIISMASKQGIKLGGVHEDALYQDWIEYHSFVLENSDHLCVLDFSEFVSRPELVFTAAEKCGLASISSDEIAAAITGAKSELDKDNRSWTTRNTSDAQRRKLLDTQAEFSRQNPKYDAAFELYRALRNLSKSGEVSP